MDCIYPIAAASILAKTFRDDYMEKIHNEFPDYDWIRNKGYPTKSHRIAIMKHGITPYHRKSFHLFDTQMKFEFTEYTEILNNHMIFKVF